MSKKKLSVKSLNKKKSSRYQSPLLKKKKKSVFWKKYYRKVNSQVSSFRNVHKKLKSKPRKEDFESWKKKVNLSIRLFTVLTVVFMFMFCTLSMVPIVTYLQFQSGFALFLFILPCLIFPCIISSFLASFYFLFYKCIYHRRFTKVLYMRLHSRYEKEEDITNDSNYHLRPISSDSESKNQVSPTQSSKSLGGSAEDNLEKAPLSLPKELKEDLRNNPIGKMVKETVLVVKDEEGKTAISDSNDEMLFDDEDDGRDGNPFDDEEKENRKINSTIKDSNVK